MLKSAVSLGVALFGAWVQTDLTGRERAAWTHIAPSTAIIGSAQKPEAISVLLDDSGLFIADAESVKSDSMDAVANGHPIKLKKLATDTATGLVLLQASPWTKGDGRPAHLSDHLVSPGQSLFVALPEGPIRAEYVRSDTVGVLRSSRRMFTLSELRFELPENQVAGGIVFTQSGDLVGAISMTLQGQNQGENLQQRSTVSVLSTDQAKTIGGGGGGRAGFGAPSRGFTAQQLGPGDLTTNYTVGLAVMKRVVTGFLSPDHQVQHPSIGIFCKDSLSGGALVTKVREDGTAFKAGMQVGDVILSIDGQRTKSQILFASIMLTKEVGQTMKVWVLRNSLQVLLLIPVGKA